MSRDKKYLKIINDDVLFPLKLGFNVASLSEKELREYIIIYKNYYSNYKLERDLLYLELLYSEIEYRKTL